MKESYQKTAQRSLLRMSRWSLCLAASIPAVSLIGCTGEASKTEVSSASSGFKPADDTGAGKKAAAGDASKAQASQKGPAPSDSNSVPPSIPTTPPLPSFDPTQVDSALAAKSYMKIELTDSQDPKELVRFLGSIDRAIQEMQKDAGARVLNNDQIFDRGMAISRMKLTAAERLEKLSTLPEEKSRALIAKLDALAQMAQFKDVASADELRIVAKQLSTYEDPKVAMQATRMQLMSSVIDLKNQAATPESILELATSVLEKMDKPDPGVFTSLAQAAQALDAAATQSETDPNTAASEACDKLVDLMEAKFRDADNPQMGMMSWRMKVQRLPNFESYLKVLDTRTAMSADPAEVQATAKDMMAKVPSPFTSIALTQCATQFEYMGNVELAQGLYDIAATQLESTKSAQLKKEIQSALDGFKAKSESIGKPLALDSLVDTEGKPLDVERYKGKVVLVDFWATWCGPCVAEIPNIQKVYEKQHDAGFEVIAVNLDDQRSDLDAFMADKKMPWSVYVSSVPDKMGMETPLARSLVINAIPFTMLIGRDGNVAAIHVRGPALEPKVAELLAATPKSE